jgi:hypothetical protein
MPARLQRFLLHVVFDSSGLATSLAFSWMRFQSDRLFVSQRTSLPEYVTVLPLSISVT